MESDHSAEDGTVYSWGDGSLGALGHGDRSNQTTPYVIRGLQDKHTAVREVVAGFAFSVAVGGTKQ